MRLHAAVVCAVACAAATVVPLRRADAETSRADDKQPPKQGVKQQQKPDPKELEALKRQIEELTRRLDAVTAQQQADAASTAQQLEAARAQAAEAAAAAKLSVVATQGYGAAPPHEPEPPAAKPAAAPKGSLKFYGYLDLAVDYATKGLSGRVQNDGSSPPIGSMGWMWAIGSNSSYVGVRGDHELGSRWLSAVFQIETQVDVAATPGYANANYFGDSRVAGALASRNSYLGLAGPWGALKAGKSDTPYYLSTRRLDPFYGTVGTMTSIMGNTGGDNRVEFGYRMPHAAWYESPKYEGFSLSGLISPGQNRNDQNLIQPQGEPNCSGYYVPGIVNPLCNDGAFGTALSAAAKYEQGPAYATVAFEWHHNANRTVDELANGGGFAPDGSIGIANEYAWKVGAEYALPTKTTVGAIYERLYRHNPYLNQDFNERDRYGTWLEVVQLLSKQDDLYFGWAHAGKTPGDVGTRRADGSVNGGPVDNSSNMYAGGYKHHFDAHTSVYAVYAVQWNHDGAHFDLGAGSHGIQYDCHDAGADAPNSGNTGLSPPGNPNEGNVPFPFGGGRCFAGGHLQAASVGMTYTF